MKAVNQLYSKLCEIFPKVQVHRYNGRDEIGRRGQKYLLGIGFVQNSTTTQKIGLPELPVDTVRVTGLPSELSSELPRNTGNWVGNPQTLTQSAGNWVGNPQTLTQSAGNWVGNPQTLTQSAGNWVGNPQTLTQSAGNWVGNPQTLTQSAGNWVGNPVGNWVGNPQTLTQSAGNPGNPVLSPFTEICTLLSKLTDIERKQLAEVLTQPQCHPQPEQPTPTKTQKTQAPKRPIAVGDRVVIAYSDVQMYRGVKGEVIEEWFLRDNKRSFTVKFDEPVHRSEKGDFPESDILRI